MFCGAQSKSNAIWRCVSQMVSSSSQTSSCGKPSSANWTISPDSAKFDRVLRFGIAADSVFFFMFYACLRIKRQCPARKRGYIATIHYPVQCDFSGVSGFGRICVFHPGGLRLETTGTTGKNNIERAPKECCFKQLFPVIKKPDGELRRCAPRQLKHPNTVPILSIL